MSGFSREKPDILLSLQSHLFVLMTISKKIKQIISELPDDYVFVASDFGLDVSQREASARALQRMAKRGEISKLANGRYYKPRQTIFGPLKPSPSQIAKDFLFKDGKIIGYLTGIYAFSQYALTTQISSKIQIGTNTYRQPLNRNGYNISFVVQPNEITEDSIELLKILDCLRFIKEIPGTTVAEACRQITVAIRRTPDYNKREMVKYAIKYTPYVRALLGAILESIGCTQLVEPLRQSLSGVSKYHLPITEDILPTKKNWRIYEPARK